MFIKFHAMLKNIRITQNFKKTFFKKQAIKNMTNEWP